VTADHLCDPARARRIARSPPGPDPFPSPGGRRDAEVSPTAGNGLGPARKLTFLGLETPVLGAPKPLRDTSRVSRVARGPSAPHLILHPKLHEQAGFTALGAGRGRKMWDVFVSYASEDRETVGRPLVEKLKHRGLSLWYDQTQLRVGDRIRRKIDEGLTHARYWGGDSVAQLFRQALSAAGARRASPAGTGWSDGDPTSVVRGCRGGRSTTLGMASS